MEHSKERGAAHIDLGTSETDVAARALYESAGDFTNREGGPDGPRDALLRARPVAQACGLSPECPSCAIRLG